MFEGIFESFLTPSLATIKIEYGFYGFRPKPDPISGSFWPHFGPHSWLFSGPLRVPMLSENTRGTNGFGSFSQSGEHISDPILGSLLGSFLGPPFSRIQLKFSTSWTSDDGMSPGINAERQS